WQLWLQVNSSPESRTDVEAQRYPRAFAAIQTIPASCWSQSPCILLRPWSAHPESSTTDAHLLLRALKLPCVWRSCRHVEECNVALAGQQIRQNAVRAVRVCVIGDFESGRLCQHDRVDINKRSDEVGPKRKFARTLLQRREKIAHRIRCLRRTDHHHAREIRKPCNWDDFLVVVELDVLAVHHRGHRVGDDAPDQKRVSVGLSNEFTDRVDAEISGPGVDHNRLCENFCQFAGEYFRRIAGRTARREWNYDPNGLLGVCRLYGKCGARRQNQCDDAAFGPHRTASESDVTRH